MIPSIWLFGSVMLKPEYYWSINILLGVEKMLCSPYYGSYQTLTRIVNVVCMKRKECDFLFNINSVVFFD